MYSSKYDTLNLDNRINFPPPIFKFDQYTNNSVIFNPHKNLDCHTELSERIKNDFLESNESSLMHGVKTF